MDKIDLTKLGFTAYFETQAKQYEGLHVGRIISQHRDLYSVLCENGEVKAKVSGKFRFEAQTQSAFPAVGDFVLLDRVDDVNGIAVMHHVLERKSAFIRKAAGTAHKEQIVAANIDTVFICMALNNDFNLRRLERYLAIAWDSNAVPVVVLTKSDLATDLEERLNEVETVAFGVEIVVTSAMEAQSFAPLIKYIEGNQTVAFIGSSGVGKSTLINQLAGETVMETGEIGNDDKGRHTTTRREMIVLEKGGMVIDTPGMRELGLEQANMSMAFEDIEALEVMCKFSNCTHKKEKGCAICQAIDDGALDAKRFANYQKLKKESKYEGLTSKQIEATKRNEMFSQIGGMKNARKYIKAKDKRR